MENSPRFIKIGKDRVDINEITCYGIDENYDDEKFFYVDAKGYRNDHLIYYEEDEDSDLYKHLAEWDKFFSENDLKWFIKFGDERIRISEIVSYGIIDDSFSYWNCGMHNISHVGDLYIRLRRSGDYFSLNEDDVDIDEKLAELDDLFLPDMN